MTFSFDWCRVLLYGLVLRAFASTGHSTGCECLVCCTHWEELWGSWDSALYCLASPISKFSLKSPTTCSSFQTGRSHRSHRSHQDVNEGNLATPKSPGQREVPLDATCPGMIGWQSGIRKGSVSVCQLPKLPCLSVLQQVRFLRQNRAWDGRVFVPPLNCSQVPWQYALTPVQYSGVREEIATMWQWFAMFCCHCCVHWRPYTWISSVQTAFHTDVGRPKKRVPHILTWGPILESSSLCSVFSTWKPATFSNFWCLWKRSPTIPYTSSQVWWYKASTFFCTNDMPVFFTERRNCWKNGASSEEGCEGFDGRGPQWVPSTQREFNEMGEN